MHLPDHCVKACRVSKVHDKVVIGGVDCEYHIQSRKDPVGMSRSFHATSET